MENHGFLYAGSDGWRLSPAYDLNPVPADVKPRVLTTAINEEDTSASPCPSPWRWPGIFELDDAKASQIASQVGKSHSRNGEMKQPCRA